MSLRVIVVDDSKVMRQIVIRTLRQAGYGDWEVIEATNGAEALELALAQQPDLVLSDWNMPEMSGIDLLPGLNSAGADIPLGFVTPIFTIFPSSLLITISRCVTRPELN